MTNESEGNKCTSEIISIAHLDPSGKFLMSREVSKKLNVSVGDELLFILDKNGYINVRRHPSPLKEGEKYLDSTTIHSPPIEHMHPKHPRRKKEMRSRIPVYLAKALNLGEDRSILWIVDSRKNVIIKNTFIFLNNIHSMIISLGTITVKEDVDITTIPNEIIDILDVNINDIIVFILDEHNNIVIKRAAIKTPQGLLGSSTIYDNYEIIINDNIGKKLNIMANRDILWAIDENGNIIIGPTCINLSENK